MIYILVGIPASGKTTRTKELAFRFNREYIIISRDSIRAELMPYVKGKFIGNLHFEERVTEIFNKRLCRALSLDYDIILDNMNIRPKYIKENLSYIKHFGKLKNTVIEFAPFTNDLDTCIKLNAARPKEEQVPEDAIRKCYETYKSNKGELYRIFTALDDPSDDKFLLLSDEISEPKYIPKFCDFEVFPDDTPIDKPTAYIFDIDGTLAAHNRSPYDYEKCNTDDLIVPNFNVLKALSQNSTIFIMSGRPEIDEKGHDIRYMTHDWLEKNNVPYDKLFMREEGDRRNDAIVKYELFNRNIRGKYKIMGVFDDRLRVISMWEELGVPVFNVNNGMGDY